MLYWPPCASSTPQAPAAATHYCIPPLERLNLGDVQTLIRQQAYFVLHAPRQAGKTSVLLALRDLLNAEGDCRCVYANVEAGQAMREDVEWGMRVILGGPQLLLQAFLQRVVNGGGRIEREYGLGRGRTDLLIVWPSQRQPDDPRAFARVGDRARRFVVEGKILRGSLNGTMAEGIVQTQATWTAARRKRGIW